MRSWRLVLRSEIRELRHALKPYRRRTTTLRRELRIRRAMELPDLVRRRRQKGSVWAIGLVRNEDDVIEACIAHFLDQGVDHVLVADNLSTDSTPAILQRLARSNPRVHVAIDHEPAFHQASKATYLARVARGCGADWIIPFDADEFWFSEAGSLAEFFTAATANTVVAAVHNALPTAADHPVSAASALMVEQAPQSLGKRAVRSHRWLQLQRGNHEVDRTGPLTAGLRVLHVAYRGPSQIGRKHAPKALADRLASAQPGEALQYRHGVFEGRDIDMLWTRLISGMPDDRLNWYPASIAVVLHPLSWKSWQLGTQDQHDALPHLAAD